MAAEPQPDDRTAVRLLARVRALAAMDQTALQAHIEALIQQQRERPGAFPLDPHLHRILVSGALTFCYGDHGLFRELLREAEDAR